MQPRVPYIVCLIASFATVAFGEPREKASSSVATRHVTWSFAAAGRRATQAGRLEVQGDRILVDLSPIPAGATMWRAILRADREHQGAQGQFEGALKKIRIRMGDPGREVPALKLRPPRFTDFDATEAVARALRRARGGGDGTLTLEVEGFAGWQRETTRLDVSLSLPAGAASPGTPPDQRAGGEGLSTLEAWHRAGQTFITWKESAPWLAAKEATIGDLRAARKRAAAGPEIRYRIYRHDHPIDRGSLPAATMVDEVDGFTACNGEFHGIYPKPEQSVLRYAVRDGEPALSPDSGVYVHQVPSAGRAWYAVSRCVDGAEEFGFLERSGGVVGPIEESPGAGRPVLQRIEQPEEFQYVKHPTLYYFVRWEAPPRSNMPSRPFDYLVAVPSGAKDPAPLCIALHCWGGSLRGGYGWWYGARDGAMMVATNQIPYDWWAAYHENLGTLKSLENGVSRGFTPKRIWSFVDWIGTRWNLDETRVFLGGSSMGGSGVSHWIRYGDRVAYGISWVGIHIPAMSDHFRGSYENVVGRLEWNLPHESGLPVFDFLDDARFLRADPAREIPFLAYSNGKNDSGIGWKQAVEFTRALQETRRPHLFVWGQAGHGQRAYFPTPTGGGDNVKGGLDIRLGESLPAFTNCSLDDDPGDGDPDVGDPEGQINQYLRWTAGEVIDEPGRYSIEIYLIDGSPRKTATVDVTPRRCQRFRPVWGTTLSWRTQASEDANATLQVGKITVDARGLATVERVEVSREKRRLVMER